MQIVDNTLNYLQELSETIDPAIFGFIGSIVDEVFAILPSPFIPIAVGTQTYQQGYEFVYLFWFALTGTIGKLIASYVTYWISDKAEDKITEGKIGKFLGLQKNQLEKYGKWFEGRNRDLWILLILRSLPFIPTLPVSVMAGVIKIQPKEFIIATLVGTYIRFMFYMIVAYEGVKKYQGILNIFEKTNTLFEVVIILGFLAVVFMYLRNNWDRLMSKLMKKNKKHKKDQ